jgi:hypothetical protein
MTMATNQKDSFDVNALRIDPADSAFVSKAGGSRKAKWQRKFVRVPWAWVDRLKSTNRGSTYRLALLLIYEDWRTGGRPIRLSNTMLAEHGVTRKAKWRALRELEQLELVKVERRPRKSPIVTPLTGPQTEDI